MAEMVSVSIPTEMWVKELKRYSSWQTAWWREVLQNAIDAGATKVDCIIEESSTDTCLVCVRDNGRGMTKEEFKNNFLVIGGTSKPAPKDGRKTAGGFGVAKKVICYAHPMWSMKSDNWSCHGIHNEASIHDEAERMDGTEVTAEVPAAKRLMESALSRWCAKATAPVIITLNGEEMKMWKPAADGKVVEKDWATIHVGEVTSWGYTYVRYNGQYMFERYGGGAQKNTLYVDLKASSSVDLFTDNRDGLTKEWDKKLQDFLTIYYTEKDTALREVEQMWNASEGNIHFLGTCLLYRRKHHQEDDLNNIAETARSIARDIASNRGTKYSIRREVNWEGMVIPPRFFPMLGSMDWTGERLLARWIAQILLIGGIIGTSGTFVPGVIFDKEAAAEWAARSDNNGTKRQVISFNPCDASGKERWANISGKEAWYEMFEMAVHEMVHYSGYHGHGPDFTVYHGQLWKDIAMNISLVNKLSRLV